MAGQAGRLADHLLDRFGSGSVFVDVESIESGADFTAEIELAIGSIPTLGDVGLHRLHLDAARAATDDALWRSAWTEGDAMSLDESIAYALSEG